MTVQTLSLVLLLSSLHFQTGSFSTPITFSTFPILLLTSFYHTFPTNHPQIHYIHTSIESNLLSPSSSQQCPLSFPTFISSEFFQFIFISILLISQLTFESFVSTLHSLQSTPCSQQISGHPILFPSLTSPIKPSLALAGLIVKELLHLVLYL